MAERDSLYRKFLPYWAVLAVTAALIRMTHALPAAAVGSRLLTGIEPVTVLKALLTKPKRMGHVMLCFGLPTLAKRAGEEDPALPEDPGLLDSFWLLTTGVRYHSPQEMLRAGLPILGFRRAAALPPVRLAGEEQRPLVKIEPPPEPPAVEPPAAEEPAARRTVLIFHTHTSECYQPISGRDHLENGAGDIVQAGEYLARSLEQEGVAVVHDRTVHDQIPFRNAYQRSQATVESLLAAHPDPLAVLDVHRDATPGVAGTIEVNGEKVARLVLVVGTDRLGLAHPNWRENHAFANALRDAAERLYPGLLARIDLADARYNQHLHPRALIVEIGNNHSTAVEVFRAAACMAKILAEATAAHGSGINLSAPVPSPPN